MSTRINWRTFARGGFGLIVLPLWLASSAIALPLQIVSQADPALGAASTGGGDSYLPVISADGRFVLFASTAVNLVQAGTNGPVPALFPAPLNVFLRDRTNNSTMLISISFDGTGGGNADSLPVGISTNGRYALFESSASNLLPSDTNNASDVFLRDVISSTTLLVSASTNGGFADNGSYSSALTPDGRYIAFASVADNLVLGDTNGIPDVFVRDMVSNVTVLASIGARNRTGTYSDIISDVPSLTPDGRYVAFYSTAANLVPGVGTLGNIYLRDLVSGITTCASSGALSAMQSVVTATNQVSFSPALSADGRYIAFKATPYPQTGWSPNVVLRYDVQSAHTDLFETNAAFTPGASYESIQNLAMTPDGRFVAYVSSVTNTPSITTAVRLWDGQTGANVLISGNTNNGVLDGSMSDSPTIDETGRFVAFLSTAPDLVTNGLRGDAQLYLRDVQPGTTMLLGADPNGIGSLVDSAMTPVLSADGRLIGFDSLDQNLVLLDHNRGYDVFLRDLEHATTGLVSVRNPALPCLSADGPSALSTVSLSSDGRWMTFWSEADDLVANDTNGLRDVYVRDLLTGTNLLISINTNGVAADGVSTDPAISGDGRFVAFTSAADDVVSGDTNQAQDVFVSALSQPAPALVSVNYSGTGPGNADSFSPVLSSNGQFVLFHSLASNLSPGMPVRRENLYWRDVQGQSTWALTTNGVMGASMTPDGRFVAYVTSSTSSSQSPDRLYVWDSVPKSIVYTVLGSGIQITFGALSISPDGGRIAYVLNLVGPKQLWVADRAANTNWAIVPNQTSAEPGLRFSTDGRFLAYVSSLPTVRPYSYQVYLYDSQTGSNLLVSVGFDGVSAADGDCDSVDLSSDGRFVAYRSAADNLVPGDVNGQPDIFLYDRLSGATTLVSASQSGKTSANNRSLTPIFSGNGRTLAFVSWASDLVPGDFNNNSDVYALGLYSDTAVSPFALTVSPLSPPALGNWLSWHVVPGKTYHVEFKDNLIDPAWQELIGPVSVIGESASLKDVTVPATSRFYRVVAY